MNNKDYTLEEVLILTEDEEGDSIVFNTYKEFRDAYNISDAELDKMIEDFEAPWGGGTIYKGYMLKRKSPSKGKSGRPTTKAQESMDSVLRFRTSCDGDHWQDHSELFTSKPKLVGYVEAFLLHETRIPDEDIKALCERLLQEGYAKWVNPDDKKDKYYILVQSEELDKLYLD